MFRPRRDGSRVHDAGLPSAEGSSESAYLKKTLELWKKSVNRLLRSSCETKKTKDTLNQKAVTIIGTTDSDDLFM